jgi:hypothetical protein
LLCDVVGHHPLEGNFIMRNRTPFRTWMGILVLLIVLVPLGMATASASNATPKDVTSLFTPKAPNTQVEGCSKMVGGDVNPNEVATCYTEPTAVEVSVFATAPAAPHVSPMEMVAAGILALSVSGLFLLGRNRK